MELRHIRVLLALADELHFGRAASRVHVAQSAVSQTLRDLEEEIGARLVERTSRHVKLTSAGQAFASYARESVRAAEAGARAALAAGHEQERVRVRLLAAVMPPGLPRVLARFQAEEPRTIVEIRDGTSARNVEALENALCDVALATFATTHRLGAEFAHMVLSSGPLAVALPSRHRLAKKKSLALEALRGERILHFERDEEPGVRARLEARLDAVGALPTGITASHPHTILALVAEGLGVAVLPTFVAHDPAAVRLVPLAKLAPRGPRAGVIAIWSQARATEPTRRLIARLSSLDSASSRSRAPGASSLARLRHPS